MTLPLSLVLIGALAALPLRAPKDSDQIPIRVRSDSRGKLIRRPSPAPPMPIPPTAEQVERLHARLAERRMREVQSHVRRDVMVFETPRESGDYIYIIQQGRGGFGGLKTLATVPGGVKISVQMDPRQHIICWRSNKVTRALTIATMDGRVK